MPNLTNLPLTIAVNQFVVPIIIIATLSLIAGYYLIWHHSDTVPHNTRILATIPIVIISLLISGAVILNNLQII